MAKIKTSIQMTREAGQAIGDLAAKLGVNRSAVLELAIRAFARENGIAPAARTEAARG
jgi:hypothetical protein